MKKSIRMTVKKKKIWMNGKKENISSKKGEIEEKSERK